MAASMDSSADVTTDLFREEFKYFKRRKPPPDLSRAIDLRNVVDSKVEPVPLQAPSGPPLAGLRPVIQWKAYTHQDTPGFVVIVNPFEAWFQRYWMKRCLVDYPCLPNCCNLDAHMDRKTSDNLWHQAVQQREDSNGFEKTTLYKLRWTTLGYHHNWDTKHYSADCRTPFPEDLADLSSYVATTLGYPEFKAEAAIINYYHLDSTLAGHTDHSELDMTAPLFSFSFGQSCIFLLGGPSKETRPVAFYLHSGDIAVMMGPARLAYHAVPRILLHRPALDSTDLPWTLCHQDTHLKSDHTCEHCQASHSPRGADVCNSTHAEKDKGKDKCTKKMKLTVREDSCINCSCGASSDNIGHAISCDGTSRSNIQSCGNCSEGEESMSRHSPAGCETGTNRAPYVEATNVVSSLPSRYVAGCKADIIEEMTSVDWTPFEAYLRTSRINMNVRQVLGKNQELPS